MNVYTTAAFNLSATGIKVSCSNTTTPLAFLSAWPLALPALPVSGGVSPINFFSVGDSKTDGVAGDDAQPIGVYPGFQTHFSSIVETSRGAGCFERPARIGRGGATAADINTNLASDLSTRNHVPDYILVNIGANDATSGSNQATFEAAYGSVLDALHTKWPAARIYCMRVWVRNYASICNSIATWIGNVLSTRAWAYLGPDERVFLEGGDNGVTYTADGIHPNHAGYLLTAEQWKTAIGL